jgi:WD40 repeat protein
VRMWGPPGDDSGNLPPAGAVLSLDAAVGDLALHPHQALVAIGRDDHLVQVWDWAHQRERLTLTQHTGRVLAVVWSPDGRWMASAGFDGVIRLWRTEMPSP